MINDYLFVYPNNDWVIVKLDSPLELNDDVQPACLPSADYLSTTETEARCFTSGWGKLSIGNYIKIRKLTSLKLS